jgi:hypothetical protein
LIRTPRVRYPVRSWCGRHRPGLRLTAANGESTDVVHPNATTADQSLAMVAINTDVQEGARQFRFRAPATVALQANTPLDWSRETNGELSVVATVRVEQLRGIRGDTRYRLRGGVFCRGCAGPCAVGRHHEQRSDQAGRSPQVPGQGRGRHEPLERAVCAARRKGAQRLRSPRSYWAPSSIARWSVRRSRRRVECLGAAVRNAPRGPPLGSRHGMMRRSRHLH